MKKKINVKKLVKITKVLDKGKNIYLSKFTGESYTYVQSLEEMIHIISSKLSFEPILGVDIECSNRSYEGFICLIQLSFLDKESKNIHTYVFDMMSIFHKVSNMEKRDICDDFLGQMLFENQDIVKIFHGSLGSSNGDIGWLQRDFGIKVVNIFDTQEFYRQIYHSDQSKQQKKKTQLSLSIFWSKYCQNFERQSQDSKKKFQLEDWSQRPLPIEMLDYAAHDSHFLIHISQIILQEVQNLP